MRIEWINQDAIAAAAASSGGVSRRSFMKAGAALGGGLVLGFFIPGANRMARAQDAKAAVYQPNAFLRIAPDNSVTVIINRLEFGQGVQTALPMILAEELDADWSQMRGELAPAGDAYKDPAFGMQITGGSGTIAHSYTQYREIGARARAMLVAAAAQQWKVKPDQVKTSKGMLIGPAGQQASYGSFADAAMKQPVPASVKLKDSKDFNFIGKPTKRLDARAKSNGTQQFGLDFKPAGTKVAVVARPPVFGAKVARLDASKAKAIKGVLQVVEVATDRGGRGVAVIADGYWPAKQGRDALLIDWDSSAVEKTDSVKQLAAYKALAATPGLVAKKADISALAAAPKKISAVYEFPYLAHAPMEPLNCVVDLKADSCTVWAGTQMQTFDHAAIVATSGLKAEQVTLHTMTAGGGFGRRAIPTSDYIVEAVNVAKAYRAAGHSGPVKVMWSREDDIKGGYYRPAHVHRAEIGLDGKGKILAWDHTIVGQSITSNTPLAGFMVKNGIDGTMIEGMGEPYDVPLNLSVHNAADNVPVLWWRSVGSTHTAFVMETLIDEAAHAAGVDPVAYRKQLLGARHVRHIAALDLAVAKSGYGKTALPKGQAWGVAMHESFNSVVAYVVTASVTDGVPKLHTVTAGVHCNQAVNPLTIEAQVQGAILMALGTTLPGAAITLKDGVVEQQNFGDYPVARLPDMPLVAVHLVPSADAPTGMGEPGFPPLAPALANAVFTLTGKRLRKLPFDLATA
ncbi:xanthine dehydrogenase family protein molybdopterin-binding subunit [Janthinobacterium agaricidamnosum]|uniref:Tat (Twin-arginine translocation) pathway signal sequence domain protein n=1 Tax=Janthinobacterium agaricidamnosum NBRC 102515 = DSM 9628 TaxID=1349767 RepID=W0V904_9BURK|nr:xanthine dehydrogenase family protein molybdopterin-binding subunit [Janthinobacterium agaricidamnosum]CDG85309.1 tat (twin-arginine translocation) pathway signal sequence domain protein [Janthinobacterium agaricidamnosum NBRC 102515 = DSM 9628]